MYHLEKNVGNRAPEDTEKMETILMVLIGYIVKPDYI